MRMKSHRPGPPGRAPTRTAAATAAAIALLLALSPGAAQEAKTTGAGPRDKTRRDFHGDCLDSGCHGELRKRRWVHGPVTVPGGCNVCHRETGRREEHRFELARSKEELCSFCHSTPAPREAVHEPFAKSECGRCHDPHGGVDRDLLVATVAKTCAACHEPAKAPGGHLPVDEGDCLACHVGHQSSHAGLLAQPAAELCFGCHKEHATPAEGQPEALAHVHEPVTKGCNLCHRGHGGPHPALLIEEPRALCVSCHESVARESSDARSAHAALGERSCAGCHAPHTSAFDHLLREASDTLCFLCHASEISLAGGRKIANVQAEIAAAAFLHGPVAEGRCDSCHRAHASPNRSLLRAHYPEAVYTSFAENTYELCFLCHDRRLVEEETTTATGFRDGDRNLHFVHVNREKGRTCGVCHEPHASASPKQMRKDIAFGPGGWRLPIGFTAESTGGSCASGCHGELRYDNTNPPGKPTPATSPPAPAPAGR